MSVINRLVDIVICLLFAINFIIWSFVIWADQFESPADMQTMVWAVQTKAWVIRDAFLPTLFILLVGLFIVIMVGIVGDEPARSSQTSRSKSESDDYDGVGWRSHPENYDEDNPRYGSDGSPILFPNLFK